MYSATSCDEVPFDPYYFDVQTVPITSSQVTNPNGSSPGSAGEAVGDSRSPSFIATFIVFRLNAAVLTAVCSMLRSRRNPVSGETKAIEKTFREKEKLYTAHMQGLTAEDSDSRRSFIRSNRCRLEQRLKAVGDNRCAELSPRAERRLLPDTQRT